LSPRIVRGDVSNHGKLGRSNDYVSVNNHRYHITTSS
jgi:hypothetical protein